MEILTLKGWSDYELLDTGNRRRLERFGSYVISRPDPQIVWKPKLKEAEWEKADAIFEKTGEDKGRWMKAKDMPEKWVINYEGLKFYAKLTPFKHTGIFPEQALHWSWIKDKIKKAERPIKVLNLFAYTGISSLAAAQAGAQVTHVDASFPTIGWAKENQTLSKLDAKAIRWIEDDVLAFVRREERRGNTYDAFIMDPPAYGRGPKGETWIFNESFPMLMEACRKIMSPNPLFFIVNAYAISSSALMLKNVLRDYLGDQSKIQVGELCLEEKSGKRLLSTGLFARASY